MENKIVTTVAAIGEAEANYDVATFTLSILVEDVLLSSVKDRLQNQITTLDQIVKEMLELHQIKIKDSINTDTSIISKLRWDNIRVENVPDGFQGVYCIKFQTESMDKVSSLYNELSLLHNVTVQKPAFSIKNSDRLARKALKNAWKKVNERFTDECEILGLNVDDYEIMNWDVLYPDSQKNSLLLGHKKPYVEVGLIGQEIQNPALIVNVNAEVAKVAKMSVNLNVSFKKKE